ncbi:DUF1028 domain-containing protein [Algoriphagus sp. D3-2-R+10]|uniref:DUF1028 domain-containing protein n=1 Tax=Algoriphagus aurantiacus TaxID=3103948 RepID=UPI002B3B43BD|nr:DUF1028 domain-containing protein [Algoriphagus sp. D3-2-R+10]MEB2777340.1 DUF1028 domain-containing protein [Algoriphagus sp. D3-2-R+10]
MKKSIFTVISFVFFSTKVFATWSIIMIDPKTNEIGIAGASCTYNCYGIGKIIPNMGAIIVQAMSNIEAREKGAEMILAETTPEQIILALRNPDFDPERQQYAVVTVKYIDSPGTYTGNSTDQYNGTLTKSGVSVQGNTLTSDSALKTIMEAVEKGQNESLNIAEILMSALEAGSTSGGDKRCGDQRASSAFILVAKPNDKKPYLNLNIFGQSKGGQNAVEMLRKKFEKFRRKHQL